MILTTWKFKSTLLNKPEVNPEDKIKREIRNCLDNKSYKIQQGLCREKFIVCYYRKRAKN